MVSQAGMLPSLHMSKAMHLLNIVMLDLVAACRLGSFMDRVKTVRGLKTLHTRATTATSTAKQYYSHLLPFPKAQHKRLEPWHAASCTASCRQTRSALFSMPSVSTATSSLA